MLAGKPGNGKTAICRAIATTCSMPVVYCALDDSDTFRILSRVDKTIRANSPCVVIFEDADSLASNPQARSTVLNLLDGLLSVPGVFTVASTNMPDKLDEAFTGRPSRFDSFHVISDPPAAERAKIFDAKLGAICASLPRTEIDDLIRKMEGLSAACVQEIAVCALLESFKTDKQVDIAMLQDAFAKVKKHMKTSDQGMSKLFRGSIGFGGNVKDTDYDDF
jgi:SpoVK/Ycf46/Vps4 family AAA+-type ATPase